MPKLVLISDTHGKHRDFEVPDGDILVFAGDMMTDGYFWPEIGDFNKWLGNLPHLHKVVIAGNHDRLFESNPVFSRGLLTNTTYLENSGCEIMGLKFWGSPYTPAFCNWAFNSTKLQLRQHWSLIPEDTDVLITHGPPYGILDKAHPTHDHLGDRELFDAIQRVSPQLHVFGHIHGGHGQWGDDFEVYGGQDAFSSTGTPIHFVNASLVDEAYKPVNKPIVVEL